MDAALSAIGLEWGDTFTTYQNAQLALVNMFALNERIKYLSAALTAAPGFIRGGEGRPGRPGAVKVLRGRAFAVAKAELVANETRMVAGALADLIVAAQSVRPTIHRVSTVADRLRPNVDAKPLRLGAARNSTVIGLVFDVTQRIIWDLCAGADRELSDPPATTTAQVLVPRLVKWLAGRGGFNGGEWESLTSEDRDEWQVRLSREQEWVCETVERAQEQERKAAGVETATALTHNTPASTPSVEAPKPAQRRLKPSVERAGKSLEALTTQRDDLLPQTGRRPSERAWEWACEHLYAPNPAPGYESWCRYIREYYKAPTSDPKRRGQRVPLTRSMIRATDRADRR